MNAQRMLRELVNEVGHLDRPMPSRSDLHARLGAVLATMGAEAAPNRSGRSMLEVYRAMSIMRAGDVRSSGDLGRALSPGLNTEDAANLGLRRLRVMLRYDWVRHIAFAHWALTDNGIATLADWEAGR